MRQLQEAHPRLYGALYPHRPVDRRVLSNLRQVTEYAAKHESRFVKLLIQQNEIGGREKDRRQPPSSLNRRRSVFRSEPHYQAAV